MIGSYFMAKWFTKVSADDDNEWINQRVYTHDESDISYVETTNRTDGAVKREHAMRYAEKIKTLRAERERAAALDAYNFLNKKDFSPQL